MMGLQVWVGRIPPPPPQLKSCQDFTSEESQKPPPPPKWKGAELDGDFKTEEFQNNPPPQKKKEKLQDWTETSKLKSPRVPSSSIIGVLVWNLNSLSLPKTKWR